MKLFSPELFDPALFDTVDREGLILLPPVAVQGRYARPVITAIYARPVVQGRWRAEP